MVTVKEVAKRAGVSTGTVSRYLSGCKLKQANEDAIRRAIDESGYKVNYTARALRNKKTYTIGIAVYRFEGEYSGAIADAAADVLEKNGYVLLVCSYNGDGSVQDAKMQGMKDRFIDGLLFYPSGHDVHFLQDFHDGGIPVVAVNEDVNFAACDKVRYEGAEPFYKVTRYLLDRGHTNIALLGGISFGTYARENADGYRRAMHEAGQSAAADCVYCDYDYYAAYREATARLVAGHVTAIVAVNDTILQAVLDAAADCGKRIPEDISIIGCYSTRFYRDRRITHLRVKGEDIGRRAAELLLRRIQGPDLPFADERLCMEFVECDSVRDLR